MTSHVELMIHLDDPAMKEKLRNELEAMPGAGSSRLVSDKPHILFVSYDPDVFDIRGIPLLGEKLGTTARLVGI